MLNIKEVRKSGLNGIKPTWSNDVKKLAFSENLFDRYH